MKDSCVTLLLLVINCETTYYLLFTSMVRSAFADAKITLPYFPFKERHHYRFIWNFFLTSLNHRDDVVLLVLIYHSVDDYF